MELLIEHKCRVLRLTLNRPDKRNALTSTMCTGIVRAIKSAQTQADVGAILIDAAGQVFCAGMDLDEAAGMHEDELADLHEDLFTIGSRSVKPIVVVVNGPALGGGLGLAAQGHVLLAAHGSVFGLPEVRIGLWPFLVYRAVEAAVGPRRTLQMSLTGQVLSVHDAVQSGLVHHVCPPAEICDRAKTLSRDLAKASPAAVSAGMHYVHLSREKSWEEAGELAKALRGQLIKSEDFREGYEAFKHKREPRWPSMPPASPAVPQAASTEIQPARKAHDSPEK